MAEPVGALRVGLSASSAAFAKDMQDARNAVKSSANSMQSAMRQAKVGFESAVKSVFSLKTAAAAAAGAAGLGYMVKRTLEATTELDKNAKMAGLSAEAYQELTYAGKQYGVTQDALTDGMKELALRADEFAVTGAGSAKEAFERLGYTQAELNGKLKDTPALFDEIVKKMEGLETAAQIRIADELFGGTGGEQFVALIQGGARALDGFKKQARDLGLVMSNDMVKASVDANIQLENLKSVLGGQLSIMVAALAPDIADLAQKMTDWTVANRDLISQDVGAYVHDIASAIRTLKDIYDNLPGGVVGAGASGLIGRMLFGSMKAGAMAAAIAMIADAWGTMAHRIWSLGPQGNELSGKIGPDTKGWDVYTGEAKKPEETPKKLEASLSKTSVAAKKTKEDFTALDNAIKAFFYDIDNFADPVGAKLNDFFSDLDQMSRDTEFLIDNTVDAIKNKSIDDALNSFFGDVDASLKDVSFLIDSAAGGTETAWVDTLGNMESAFSGWANTYSNALNEMLWGSELTFDKIAESFGKMITEMLIQEAIMKPMTRSLFAPGTGLFPSVFSAIDFHSGGIAGTEGTALWNTAPRYHSGLMPNEVPAILKNDEGVFTKGQMDALGRELNSGGGTTIYNIQAIDVKSFQDVLRSNRAQITKIIAEDMRLNGITRQTMRQTL